MSKTVSARRVVTDDGILHDHAVVINHGQIVAIEPSSEAVDHELVAPGFVDIQVNGHLDVDVATMSEADWPRIDQILTAQGVTAWCPTLITASREFYDERLDHLQRLADEPAGPTVVGVHLEGPYLGDCHGAHTGVPEGPIDLDWIASLPDIVRLMTIGPERSNAIEAITQLTQQGITVALGHTAAGYEQTTAAIEAGARVFTHCFNAVAPLHHREPGPVGAALTNDAIAIGLIVDTVHIHPAVVRLAWHAKPQGQIILVTDAAAWQSGRLGTAKVTHRDGAPRLADGTLAGSSLTMNNAVRNAVVESGIEVADAIHAATANPARALGLEGHGSLAVGSRADLVALDERFGITNTWISGEPV